MKNDMFTMVRVGLDGLNKLYVLRDKSNRFVSLQGKLFEIKDDFIGSPIIGIVVIVIAVELEFCTLHAFSSLIQRKSFLDP